MDSRVFSSAQTPVSPAELRAVGGSPLTDVVARNHRLGIVVLVAVRAG